MSVDADEARRRAEALMAERAPSDQPAHVAGIEEHADAYVVFWGTAQPPNPGTGPIAVPKDGRPARYLSTQRLDWALFDAGLGPEPSPESDEPDW